MMKNSNKAVHLGIFKFMLCQNSEAKEYSNSALRPQTIGEKKCFSNQKEEMVIPGK